MPVKFDTGLPTTGALQLQVCGRCSKVNYPSRELCGNCLADALQWQFVADGGVVQSLSELHYSLEENYAALLPLPVASVELDCGPIVFAHLQPGLSTNDRVTLRVAADSSGNHMLVAHAANGAEIAAWLDNIQFNEDSQ